MASLTWLILCGKKRLFPTESTLKTRLTELTQSILWKLSRLELPLSRRDLKQCTRIPLRRRKRTQYRGLKNTTQSLTTSGWSLCSFLLLDQWYNLRKNDK